MSVETNSRNYTNINNTFSQFLPARISPKEISGANGKFLSTPGMRETSTGVSFKKGSHCVQ